VRCEQVDGRAKRTIRFDITWPLRATSACKHTLTCEQRARATPPTSPFKRCSKTYQAEKDESGNVDAARGVRCVGGGARPLSLSLAATTPARFACQSVISKISHHNPCGQQLQRGDVLERAHHGSHTRHTTSQRTVPCTPKKRTKLLDRHGSSRPTHKVPTQRCSVAECCNFLGFQHVNQPYCSIALGGNETLGGCVSVFLGRARPVFTRRWSHTLTVLLLSCHVQVLDETSTIQKGDTRSLTIFIIEILKLTV
jgi:hypothetical protein